MAKDFKNQKGLYEMVGVLKEINLINKKDSEELSRLELIIQDKDMESEVKLNIFPSNIAKYWDNKNKKTVEVTSRIEETMKEVKANNIGSPFGIEMKTPKGTNIYYVNDELISNLCKLQANKFTVKIIGNIDFKIYNNRVQKNYTSIKSIEILAGKQKHGFFVNFSIVISEINKNKFVYGDNINKVTGLVKTKLENGQYSYKPIEIGLDKKYFMKGLPIDIAKQSNCDILTLINEKLMKLVKDSMMNHQGYVCMSIIGRLKSGEITKKPTIEDLNPMERVLLEMQGEKALKDKLDNMELIKEYFDSVILDSFNFEQGEVAQEIQESELNLEADTTNSISNNSNPMLDVLKSMTDNKETNDIFGNTEKQEETQSSTTEKLEKFVNETENNESNENSEVFDDDSFPF